MSSTRKAAAAATPAPQPPEVASSSQRMTVSGLLVRLYWLAFGNLILLALLFKTAQAPSPGIADALFWSLAASLIGVRYLDVVHFHGLTSEGKPATVRDWRRYALQAGVVFAAAWGLARAVAPISL